MLGIAELHRQAPYLQRSTRMSVSVKDNKGTVRNYEFVSAQAAELFLEDLPSGWEVLAN
jgi:hypothetical protein